MKTWYYFFLILAFQSPKHRLLGQAYCEYKYDAIWLFGDRDQDTIENRYGGCEINFNSKPITLNYHPKSISAPFQNASICSSSGVLLCYSNGCEVMNGQDQIVVNGDSLNPGEIFAANCPDIGYNGFQNMFILPFFDDSSLYYIFHIDKLFNYDSNAAFVVHSANVYYSKLDITASGGVGELLEKNHIIVHDTGLLGSPMTAVRHGNGRDWWILTPDRWSNGFFTTKLDSKGPEYIGVQYVGDATDPRATGGQGKFSPDGSKFAWYHPLNGLFLYDFDRMNGVLSKFVKIDLPTVDFITGGCEFSPTGRFLYVNQDTSLFQLDMDAKDLQQSLIKIADYDGFGDPLPTTFFLMERTPDNRIIVNTLNGSQYLHVIQEPDRKGNSCRFEQHAITLPTINNFTLPHFPNYQLGSLNDPLCDSLFVSTESTALSQDISIFPNPASDFIFLANWKEGNTVYIMDILGNLVLDSQVNPVRTEELYPGVYFVLMRHENHFIAKGKFVVSKI